MAQTWGGGPSGSSPNFGGLFANPILSEDLRAQAQPLMRYRQFVRRESQFGKHMGDTLLFDKVFNLETQGGQIAEGSPIPKTRYPTRQGSCIAVPYGQAIEWTEELELFSQFDLSNPNHSRLIDDVAKAFNIVAEATFAKTKIYYTPTGTYSNPTNSWGTAGTFPATATRDLQVWDLKEITDAFKRGVYGTNTASPAPLFDGENYINIASVGASRAIRDDPEFEDYARFGDPDRLFAGETGRIVTQRVIEDNHVLPHLMGTTNFKGNCIVFAEDPVIEIDVLEEEIRQAIPGDFGRDNAMAWYAVLGMQVVWSYTAVTEPENRVVVVGSL